MARSKKLHTLCRLLSQASKNDNCVFGNFGRIKKKLHAGPELKLENYESMQPRPQFSGIKKGGNDSEQYSYSHLHFEQSERESRLLALYKMILC